jgi:hypothetical protein
MVDFAEALSRRASDVEKPQNLPRGTYVWKVSKVPAQSESNNGEWTIVEVPLQCVEATDDVDPDELEAFGSVAGERNRISFMFPTDKEKKADFERTLYRLKEFLTRILGLEDNGATLRELLDASVNYQFIASAVWTQGKDGETYVNVQNYAPL